LGNVGVEPKIRAMVLRLAFQQMREVPAVADAVQRQVDGGVERSFGAQPGFDLAAVRGVDQLVLGAQLAQHSQACLRRLQLARRAQRLN
jgi:hypothetical protein